MSKNVDLGFFNGDFEPWDCEKDFEDFELESRYFPSKVGGKPAWLDLALLPKPITLQCRICGSPTKFLLQVYSPDDKVITAFHRTIFVFICVNKTCWSASGCSSRPVVVLRSQLARENRFYPAQPPQESPGWRTDITAQNYGALCPVCGCRGDKVCGRCKSVAYCSQLHQKADWKKGHKLECKEGCVYAGPHTTDVFREGLIEIEEEPDKDPPPYIPGSVDYSSLVDMEQGMECEDTKGVAEEDWEEVEKGQTIDKASEKFNKRIRRAPYQIIRHDRDGVPLLVTFSSQETSPPRCGRCSAQRSFEFQIMPQMLNLLGLGTDVEGGVDWGSIYIYTCSRSCEIEGYVEEEAHVLHFDSTNLPMQ